MTQICKILLVGDANLRRTLAAEFSATQEFVLIEADDLESLAQKAKAHVPDLILLSGEIAPDSDIVIDALRKDGFCGPVLLLCSQESAKAPARHEQISRPFRFADLISRMRRLLQCDRGYEEIFSIGPFRFSPRSKALIRDESDVLRLTDTEAAILARLAQAQGESISRNILLRDVWGYSPTVTTRTLETHIHRLRQKMERNPAKPSLLVTEHGGYRLMRDVSARTAKDDELPQLRELNEHGPRK